MLGIERERNLKLRQGNAELLGMREEWRCIENQFKWMKQMDSTIDHLW